MFTLLPRKFHRSTSGRIFQTPFAWRIAPSINCFAKSIVAAQPMPTSCLRTAVFEGHVNGSRCKLRIQMTNAATSPVQLSWRASGCFSTVPSNSLKTIWSSSRNGSAKKESGYQLESFFGRISRKAKPIYHTADALEWANLRSPLNVRYDG